MNPPEVFRPIAVSPPDRYLVGDEEALLTVRRHWADLSRAAVETLAVWIIGIRILVWLPPTSLTDIIGLVLIAALLRFLWEVVKWWRTTITVSDKRLFILSGVFTRRLSMLPLSKVTDMTLVQPLPGRFLGYGSIIVESAGQNQALSDVHFIPNAMDFYQLIAGMVFDGKRAGRRSDETVVLDGI